MKHLAILLVILVCQNVFATKIQIIHINDLHSYFASHPDGRGGYAKVKTKIDELKAAAFQNGIQSIVLDAGDWGEGTSFFLTDEGANSLRALDLMGVDVSIIGNHDHMMGGKVLSEQIKKANIKTKILSANLIQTDDMDLKDIIKGTHDIEVDGIKVHIIGLSTPEPHHQAPLLPGFMAPPESFVFNLAKKAREDGKDLIVALTHLGVAYDKKIAKDSEFLDVIVGGHSHTRLDEIEYKKNDKGRKIPIVQASAHGLVVGSLVLDVKGPGNVEVVNYQLHDVVADTKKDNAMESLVSSAENQRNNLFDGRWDEVIGESEITLSGYHDGHGPKGITCWGNHMARITKIGGSADVGVHLSNFAGMEITPGPITLGNLVDNYPHFRNYGDNGWEISKFDIKGKELKKLIHALIGLQNLMGVHIDGVTYNQVRFDPDVPILGGINFALFLRIDGKKIDKKKTYTVALPSEIEYVLRTFLTKKADRILPKVRRTGSFFWPVMEQYVMENSPLKCIGKNAKNH